MATVVRLFESISWAQHLRHSQHLALLRLHRCADGRFSPVSKHFMTVLKHTVHYLQERRVIEYVSLGDFQTAVGFLLASTPEKSIRYYRDALCTLALAVSHLHPDGEGSSIQWANYCTSWRRAAGGSVSAQPGILHGTPNSATPEWRSQPWSQGQQGSQHADMLQAASSEPYVEVGTGKHETVSRTLHIQAAKVVAAHAASVGDALLGVPLLCSAGEVPQHGDGSPRLAPGCHTLRWGLVPELGYTCGLDRRPGAV